MMIKWIFLIILLVAIAYGGLTCYSNLIDKPSTGQADMPSQEKASYSVYIQNTGNLILTDDYEVHGSQVGSRVFILHSFWELRGQEFEFIEADIVLDEAIFGVITIKQR